MTAQILYRMFQRLQHLVVGRRTVRGIPCATKRPYLPSLELFEDRTVPTTFIVNSLGDDNVGVGNTGDLRYVINRANAEKLGKAAAPHVIQFSGVTLTATNQTIHVGRGAAGARPLPNLTTRVIIDGTTAGGFNNLTGVMLTLDGGGVRGRANGLTLLGGGSTIRGLQIIRFSGNGILVNSSRNVIGGDAVGFTASGDRNNPAGRITSPLPPHPTTSVHVRPPQGNVIGANGGDGVRFVDGANHNLVLGNYIGTDVSGVRELGNGGNGVTILDSNFNQILGTTAPDKDNPFVFYNVISGNRGNGLVVENSNSTTIYANFFGLGADNKTPLGNHRNGVLIKGTSDQTKFGANIPLGNVSAANGQNGVEVRDSASRTVLGNTFGGTAAFNPSAQVGNLGNGILITSDGGNRTFRKGHYSTLVLTCNLSGNGGSGVAISGNARGVQVTQSVIGMQTNGQTPQPNGRNGVRITGNASRVTVGGFEPSVAGVSEFGSFLQAANLISGNRGHGVEVGGSARDVRIFNSIIGVDIKGTAPAGNGGSGIFLGGVSGVQVGSKFGAATPGNRNIIAFNAGDGVTVRRGTENSILGNSVYTNGGQGIGLVARGNENQRAPVLTSATVQANGLTVLTGTLKAQASTTYQIEGFASASSQPGNGQQFLGFVRVKTNRKGVANFTLIGTSSVNPANTAFFTATATSKSGNTSMFSQAIRSAGSV